MSAQQRYFAAISSGSGFINRFSDYFDPDKLDRLYIIKGGPGTGKSTVMKRVAEAAEKKGFEVIRCLCSSDPGSLDGILVPKLSFGMTDGTAPHAADPRYPGAVDVILDLYPFFDVEKLRREKEELVRLYALSAAFRKSCGRCRRFAALALSEELAVTGSCLNTEKLGAAADRCAAGIRGRRGGAYLRQISAFSTVGEITLDTYGAICREKVAVCDEHGSAFIFMNELKKRLTAAGTEFYYSVNTLLPQNCEAIFVPEDGRYFHITGKAAENGAADGGKRVNMKRFVISGKVREARTRLRTCEKAVRALNAEALRLNGEAGVIHGMIEEIYKNAVDFDGVSGLTDDLIGRILP